MKRRAALVLTIGLVFAGLAAYALAGQSRATGPASVLAVLSGGVELAHGTAAYAAASDGETVTAGDRIRTDAAGRAVVTFFDGSTVEIAPVSDITIEAAAMRDGAVDLVISQAIGRTFSSVHKLLDPRSRYEIRTPSLTAAVRGTKFEVEVAADGSAAERTTEGLVAVSSAGAEVLVPAGAATNATPGAPPAPPAPIAPPVPTPTAALGTPAVATGTPVATEGPIRSPTATSSPAGSAAVATAPAQTTSPISVTAAPTPVTAPAPLGQLPSPTLLPLPTLTSVPVPTATVGPLPTTSLLPLPTASIAPLPTVSTAPLPTVSTAPLPTASIAPVTAPSPSIGVPTTTIP